MRPTNIIEIDFFNFKGKASDLPPPLPTPAPEKTTTVKPDIHAASNEGINRFQDKKQLEWSDCKAMIAKYDGKCSETGVRFQAGDWILYDFFLKLAYRFDSETTKHYLKFLTELRASL